MLPLVSIILPTYKREEAFKRALFSLGEQTYQNFEIIVVDDSADEKWNAKNLNTVEEFRRQYKEIKLNYIVNSENQGSAKTRNIGIENAKGEYITFLDDDDIYLPEKTERQVSDLIQNGADFGITDLCLYNEKGILVDKRTRDFIKNTDKEALLKYHLTRHLTGTDTLMFKKEYLLKIGGFDPIDVGDEFYLIQKAILGGGKFSYLKGCSVKAFVHSADSGLSGGEGKIKGENELYEYKKTFFDSLDKETVRYIKARHFAVLAYAHLKERKLSCFFCDAFKAFVSSPIQAFKIFLSR